MQIDVNRLKGKTVELGLTGAAVAEKLGIDQSTYYRKLGAGGGSFTIAQAQMISKILEAQTNVVLFFLEANSRKRNKTIIRKKGIKNERPTNFQIPG